VGPPLNGAGNTKEKCERGDWLLWLAGKIGIDRKVLVLAACDCAERALKYVEKGEDRPRVAIATARKWANGDEGITIEDVRDAADAADAAADAADANAAAYAARAAYAAAYAAYAANAVDAAEAAANAAAYAADYAAYAAEADAYAAELQWSANKVRERITWKMIEKAINS
jgi:hypothetical protein